MKAFRFVELALCLSVAAGCGPYQIKYWLVTIDQNSLDPGRWPASCFPGVPADAATAAATLRTNNADTFESFRTPMRWQTWDGKDKQFFLGLDGLLIAFARGIATATGMGGTGGFNALPNAPSAMVIEGSDGKTFSATFTDLAQAAGAMAPQLTYTTSLRVTWANQDNATSGTIDITVTRACSGGMGNACMDAAYSCAITGVPFVARRIENVQASIQVSADPS